MTREQMLARALFRIEGEIDENGRDDPTGTLDRVWAILTESDVLHRLVTEIMDTVIAEMMDTVIDTTR